MTRQPERRRRVTWRDFWLVAITGLLLIVVIQLQNTASDSSDTAKTAKQAAQAATRAVDSVQVGRMNSSRATCAIASAVSLAGKEVIAGEAAGSSTKGPPTRQDRTLQALGFGTRAKRAKAARTAAHVYVQSIVTNFEKFSHLGTKSKGIVNKDGTFNCQALLKLGKIS